jgi:hypothetical protein
MKDLQIENAPVEGKRKSEPLFLPLLAAQTGKPARDEAVSDLR